jgi:putative ABC transport system ATP-binding protein
MRGSDKQMLLELEKIQCSWPGRAPLGPLSLRLAAGQHMLLLGPSGSGKTTLLLALAGLRPPQAGTVRIAGTDPYALGESARDAFRARNIALIFQSFHLIPALSVIDNIRLAGEPEAEMLAALGLTSLLTALPRHLSHGQAQRVAIARALAARPRLLLADEPTAALDDGNAATVARLLLDLAAQAGTTLIIATHDNRLRDITPHQVCLGASVAEGKSI